MKKRQQKERDRGETEKRHGRGENNRQIPERKADRRIIRGKREWQRRVEVGIRGDNDDRDGGTERKKKERKEDRETDERVRKESQKGLRAKEILKEKRYKEGSGKRRGERGREKGEERIRRGGKIGEERCR